jgi:hypothetical protein
MAMIKILTPTQRKTMFHVTEQELKERIEFAESFSFSPSSSSSSTKSS